MSAKQAAAVRQYEELEGGTGRGVFFRPDRHRAADLLPLRPEVFLTVGGQQRACVPRDLSESGVAFEWPFELTPVAGSRLEDLTVLVDGSVAYRGEAKVESLREVGGVPVVGASLHGPSLPMDELLNLQRVASRPEVHAFNPSGAPWRVEGMERYKVLVGELALFLEDQEAALGAVEAVLPWHVLHGPPTGLARSGLVHRLMQGFVPHVVRATEEIDAAFRAAPGRSVAALGEWSRRHLDRYFLQAPCFRRCKEKPLGYPGDYECMRFIYESPFEGETLFARAMNLAFDQTRPAQAVRSRKDRVKARLKEMIDTRRQPLRFLSLAAGPAQELFELITELDELPAPLELVLFDQDKGALGHAFRRLKPLLKAKPQLDVRLVYLHESIMTLLKDPTLFESFGLFDAVFSCGLFDYLPKRTAISLARTLASRLAPGGSLLIANMVLENPGRWQMEQHADWHLIHRTREQMLEIGRAAAPDAAVEILEEASGINPFVQMTRG